MSNTSIPKGTRDFSPLETARRNYIFDSIREVYKLFGFVQIETPAMEQLDTLTGKYGDEGDKLLFRILNSGNFLRDVPKDLLNDDAAAALSSRICEKGLRYDLTVPFARYVVQHRNEITFPFKRFQIQPVWRADRPQKGRYREFYQCDADVIGSSSLLNETELLQIIEKVFSKLNIDVTVKINNRKILAGIAEIMNMSEHLTELTVAIDKTEKIGLNSVKDELKSRGFTENQWQILEPILILNGSSNEKLTKLDLILHNSKIAAEGLNETRKLFSYVASAGIKVKIELDLALARGLNYYTGAIIEVKANGVEIGSICGGGRYDNLTGIFGLKNISGVGISFGADRIYDVLTALELFPKSADAGTQIMFANMGEEEEIHCLNIANALRMDGVAVELYPENAKLKKQLEYADKKGIPFVAIIGGDEIKSRSAMIRNMRNREQTPIELTAEARNQLISIISTV
jgi:histidyl-tRNA synthetase